MPTNKNAQLRYQILDRCFSNRHRNYTIEDLVDAVNEALYDMYGTEVSIRQIREDIKYMRDRVSFNAPIEAVPFDGRRSYYRYSDRNFSIFNNELTVEEITKLSSTIDMLGRYRGGNNGWLEEIISSLEMRFGIKANKENIVSFDQNDKLKGLEFLSELIDCAINHQPIKLFYKTYSGKENVEVIHPYHVKQYNNRWFLFGLEQSPYGDRIANRALDRIEKFSKANVPFIPNTTVDFSTRYVVSKPIHHSQKILDTENCVLQIEVRPNKELESVIFSYFPHVEVLEPATLREQFKEKISKNLKKYL